MIKRFLENEQVLIDSLKQQSIIQGNENLAKEIKEKVELKKFKSNEYVISQNEVSDQLFFLLSGTVSIMVNGREVARRNAGTHFGEMAVINPAAKRSASVVCIEDCVIAILSSMDFNHISNKYQNILRFIALELSNRLAQRNRLVRPVNIKPVIFIASSKESLSIAEQFKHKLEDDTNEVKIWSDLGVFTPSRFPIQDLEDQVKASDFAVIILGADDKILSRWKLFNSTRDNVLIELGLFMGALSHERTFIALPAQNKIKIPSDLFGINMLYINQKNIDEEIQRKALEVKNIINKYGCI